MIVQVDILKEIAEVEFSDIVAEVVTDINTLQIILQMIAIVMCGFP